MIPRLGLAFLSSLLGKALGFVRLQAIAVLLGPTAATDTLLLSLTVLSAFDSIFVSGSAILFIQALYLRREVRGSSAAANVRFARSAALWSYLAATFGIALALFALPASRVLAPGFAPETRVLFAQLCLIGAAIPAASAFMVYLSALNRIHGREVLYTINPLVINGASIAAIIATHKLGLSPLLSARALMLAILAATLAMAAFQATLLDRRELVIVVEAFKRAIVPTRFVTALRAHLRELSAVSPIVGSLLLQQAIVFVSYSFASKLGQGSLTMIGLADRLVNVVFALFVATFLTVLEPRWARRIAQPGGKFTEIGNDLLVIGILLIPLTVTLVLCGGDIVRLLFGYGAYAGGAASELATLVLVYSLALPGLSLALLFSRVIIIAGRSTRLTLVNLALLALHFAICRVLTGQLGLQAIAVSFVLSMSLQALAYRWILGAPLVSGIGSFVSLRIVLLTAGCSAAALATQQVISQPAMRITLVLVAATAATVLGAVLLRLPLLESSRRLLRL